YCTDRSVEMGFGVRSKWPRFFVLTFASAEEQPDGAASQRPAEPGELDGEQVDDADEVTHGRHRRARSVSPWGRAPAGSRTTPWGCLACCARGGGRQGFG